ncbi:hypothetical protein ACTG4Q_20755 [Bradyrhizobium denitrificans]
MTDRVKDLEITPEMLERAVESKALFGSNISPTIGGERVPVLEFTLTLPKPEIDTLDLLSTFTTTNLEVVGTVEFTEEQEKELAQWWIERMEQEFLRRLTGSQSEYTESLRATGAKV